ncbi:MAG TPA: hypothetical protein VFV87_09390 [Pirellulaceae bacterium]|nr:hypothetical protein [Pirellulaceae bacterium]
MFGRFRKLAARSRQRLLSLVMLPAFFLATLPHTACICGDGHRVARCNAVACCAIKAGKSTGVSCGCPCCQSHSGKPCCCKAKQAKPACDKCPLPGLAAKTGNCCQPVIEAPAPAKSVEKVSPVSPLDVAIGGLPPTFADAAPGLLARRVLDHHGPPPVDVVIVYLHLTI